MHFLMLAGSRSGGKQSAASLRCPTSWDGHQSPKALVLHLQLTAVGPCWLQVNDSVRSLAFCRTQFWAFGRTNQIIYDCPHFRRHILGKWLFTLVPSYLYIMNHRQRAVTHTLQKFPWRWGGRYEVHRDRVGRAVLMHFGIAKSHILARAERNPHTTLSGEEQTPIFAQGGFLRQTLFLLVLFQNTEFEF